MSVPSVYVPHKVLLKSVSAEELFVAYLSQLRVSPEIISIRGHAQVHNGQKRSNGSAC